MIKGLVKILIFDKMATSQKLCVLCKNLHFKVAKKSKSKKILRRSSENLKVNGSPISEKFSSPTMKTAFREKHVKVLGVGYTKLKSSYKYAYISETICLVNSKFLENIFK